MQVTLRGSRNKNVQLFVKQSEYLVTYLDEYTGKEVDRLVYGYSKEDVEIKFAIEGLKALSIKQLDVKII